MVTMQNQVNKIVRKAGDELGIPFKQAIAAYRGYWLFIKELIESMPLEDSSEEEYEKLRTSINVNNLGKFHTSYERVQRIKKSEKIIYDRTYNKKRKAAAE